MSLENSLALIFGGCCSNVFALEAIIKHEPDSGLLITTAQLFIVSLFTFPTQLERRSSTSSPTTSSRKDQLTPAYTHHDPHPTSSFLRLLLPYKIRTPCIPYTRLLTASILFCLVNLLNNWAFAFDISVPMHIILRSFGSVITLVVGWWVGKRYGRVQVLGVLGLTVGVLMAAWADAGEKGADLSLGAPKKASTSSFTAGLIVLFIAQFLGAVMGVYTEETYARHGRHWREILFYTHFFGLLFSLILLPSLLTQFQRLLLGPRISLPLFFFSFLNDVVLGRNGYITLGERLPRWAAPYYEIPDFVRWGAHHLSHLLAPLARDPNAITKSLTRTYSPSLHYIQQHLPSQSLLLLLLNSLTQYLCISGVNQLGAATSAVTVTVVLNVRKLASFLLSCWIFGNRPNGLMVWGAGVVFVSGAVYGLGGALGRRNLNAQKAGKNTDVRGGIGAEKFDRAGQVDGARDSLAIAKGYATTASAATSGAGRGGTSSIRPNATGKSCSSSRTPWREVRDSVHGMMRDANTNTTTTTNASAYTVAGMAELDGSPAIVNSDGSMSPRRLWPRRESMQSLSSSPDLRQGERDGDGYATALGARLNADGSMTRR